MADSVTTGKETAEPRPTLAERARTLAHTERDGSLATHSAAVPGYPFTSLAPFATDSQGRPIFLFSKLAQHTRNLSSDPRGSLLMSRVGADGSAPAGPRATLIGDIARVDEGGSDLRSIYLQVHPGARNWIDFADFSFYRMDVHRAYHVSGFGSMGWIEGPEYSAAAVDPLADAAEAVIRHMNEDHADALILYARVLADFDAERAKMSGIDRLGFELFAERGADRRRLRIAFAEPVHSANEARKALVEMVRDARATS